MLDNPAILSDTGSMSTYPGGKSGSGVYQAIINQLPPHRLYIEAFLGSGAIMRFKRPAISSIGIDSDAAVTAAFVAPIPNLALITADALEWLANTPIPGDALVYLDPPYLMSTRSSKRAIYPAEFGDVDQHRQLLELARTLPCPVAISGYYSDLYAELLPGWRSITFPAMTRGGGVATEWLWMNYPPPFELHDCQYLGKNFRERERINRKKRRWSERLKRMDPLERQAMLAAIDELRGSTSAGNGDAS